MAAVALLAWTTVAMAGARVLDGLAIVQDDGSLSLDGEKVWLHGASIPLFVRTCTSIERPPRCGSRSVLVLANLVSGFVRCQIVRQHPDALEGVCTQAGRDSFGPRQDLAAELILRGWALATPDAPSDYFALQTIAQSQEAGIWGAKQINIR
jgi:hypothetical protein